MAPNRHKLTLLERARQKCRDYDGKSMWDWYKYDLTRWEDIGEEEYVKEASLEDPIVLECWKYENEDITSGFTIPEDEVKYIKEDDIPAWLERSPPGERLPCAGLRLIHKFQHPEVLDGPSNQQMFATINDKFGLPDVLWRHTATLPGACGKFMSTDSRSVLFICKRTYARCTVSTVLRHDFETNITVGYLFSQSMTRIHHALLEIPQQFRILAHPLLVPFLIEEQMLADASKDQYASDRSIFRIEDATGFNSYVVDESDLGPQDYRKLSKDLGDAATFFAHAKARLLALKAMHDFCSRQLTSCQSWIPTDKWENYAEPTRILLERAEYMTSQIEHMLTYRGQEMRLQVQQNIIFNLIAQEDNRSNIRLSQDMRQIAVKTKRDGSIMKSIAFLGTLFLPATFVSTFFAMPLFNWGAPTTSEIVGNHFWIYWAVTGPLTIMTMTIVGYWILSRTQKNMNDKSSHSEEDSLVDENSQSNNRRPSRFESLKGKLKFIKKRQPKIEGV